jgi:hypothetical protein
MKAYELIYQLVKFGLNKDVHFSETGSSILCQDVGYFHIQERNLIRIKKLSKWWINEHHLHSDIILEQKKAIIIRVL